MKCHLPAGSFSPDSSRLFRKYFLAATIGLSIVAFNMPPGLCDQQSSDDTGFYGSVSIQRSLKAACDAMRNGNYGIAQTEYKNAIGQDPQQEDFYFGLYETSKKLNQWDQVALALEQLFIKNPDFKKQMTLEYGECLFKLNRYDEAEPMLKTALNHISEPSLVERRFKRLLEKSEPPKIAPQKGPVIVYVPPKPVEVKPRAGELDFTKIDDLSPAALTPLNAFMKSETIVIATYKGYRHKGAVTFYTPPTAQFVIEKFLKGPPLNKALPVRYEFHPMLRDDKKPEGWKFAPDMMPEKGSKWLIFIPNSVPVNGEFVPFHGSYGIRALTEENLDEIQNIMQTHQGQGEM